MELLEINKVSAAREHFKEATLLFFEKRSAVAIHHLVHAAHEVLRVITGDNYIFDHAALMATGLKEFKYGFNGSKNFIKHADKDPNAVLIFKPESNVFLLFDCASIITKYIDKECVYSRTVIIWCAYAHPKIFDSEYVESIKNLLKIPFDYQNFEAIAADLKLHY